MTPITPKNIIRHELVGLNVNVIRSSNLNYNSISGQVVDESRNTFLIKHGDSVKRIAKKDTLFKFVLPDCCVEVEGSVLISRPEDRVKRNIKRRW